MWTRQLLKQNAKIAFQRNYWACVAVSVLAGLLGVSTAGSVSFNSSTEDTSTGINGSVSFSEGFPSYILYVLGAATLVAIVLGLCFSILLSNVVAVGCNRYFLENREHKTEIGVLFHGFKNGRYGSNVWVMFLKGLYIFGWSLLFIIPGIIKAYQYLLVPYILAENENLDKDRIFEMSKNMMEGHKMEAFILELSFFGWALLSAISLGLVGIFWVNPYIHATMAEFYSALKSEAIQNGTVLAHELPGVSAAPEMNFEM